jgi:uncharacterized protein (DUF433 family)
MHALAAGVAEPGATEGGRALNPPLATPAATPLTSAPQTRRTGCTLVRGGASVAFDRITVRTDQMGGVPCIRGLRVPVATVVGMVADGMTSQEILAAYPDLEAEDVEEALRYAAEAVRERELPLEVPDR